MVIDPKSGLNYQFSASSLFFFLQHLFFGNALVEDQFQTSTSHLPGLEKASNFQCRLGICSVVGWFLGFLLRFYYYFKCLFYPLNNLGPVILKDDFNKLLRVFFSSF